MPVTVVPRSLATGRIDTFMTEVSRVMRNWAEARMSRTDEPALEESPPPLTFTPLVSLNGVRSPARAFCPLMVTHQPDR